MYFLHCIILAAVDTQTTDGFVAHWLNSLSEQANFNDAGSTAQWLLNKNKAQLPIVANMFPD